MSESKDKPQVILSSLQDLKSEKDKLALAERKKKESGPTYPKKINLDERGISLEVGQQIQDNIIIKQIEERGGKIKLTVGEKNNKANAYLLFIDKVEKDGKITINWKDKNDKIIPFEYDIPQKTNTKVEPPQKEKTPKTTSETTKNIPEKKEIDQEILSIKSFIDGKIIKLQKESEFFIQKKPGQESKKYKIIGTIKRGGKFLIEAENISDKKDKLEILPDRFEKFYNSGEINLAVSGNREEELKKFVKTSKLEKTKKQNIKKNIEPTTKSPEPAKKLTTLDQIAEILKNKKIDEIIVSQGKEGKSSFKQDLDSRMALYLLHNLNNKELNEIYSENAKSTIIDIRNKQMEPKEKTKGVRVFIDAGGEWVKIEENGETTTLWIDHHGEGKRKETSGTKMMYEIMQKNKTLKENPEWLKKFVNFVNEYDNLSYLKNEKGERNEAFTENYFKNNWSDSLYAIAEQIPFDILMELIESGDIKNPSKPFTEEELKGELGTTKLTQDGLTIADLCKKARAKAIETIDGIKNADKIENTVLGKVIYHNFKKIPDKNNPGQLKTNYIEGNRGFIGTVALKYETFITWSRNNKNKTFHINSNHPDLSNFVKKLNELEPECATDVRGVMVFGKIKGNLTEKKFLELLKNPDSIKTEPKIEPVKLEPAQETWTKEDEKNLQKLDEDLTKISAEMTEREKRMNDRAEEITRLEAELKKLIQEDNNTQPKSENLEKKDQKEPEAIKIPENAIYFGNKYNKELNLETTDTNTAGFAVFNVNNNNSEVAYVGKPVNLNYFDEIAIFKNNPYEITDIKSVKTISPGKAVFKDGKWKIVSPFTLFFSSKEKENNIKTKDQNIGKKENKNDDYETKETDIERRRQEELKKLYEYNDYIARKSEYDSAQKINSYDGLMLVWAEFEVKNPDKNWSKSSEELRNYAKKYNEINTKYDAELAELKKEQDKN